MKPLLLIAALSLAACSREPANVLDAEAALASASPPPSTSETPRRSPPQWQEGKHYERIEPPQPITPGKTEVMEFFSYLCGHCSQLEPVLEYWEMRAPENAVLIRVPVVWERSDLIAHARMYYTLQQLGRMDLHHPFFQARYASSVKGMGQLDTFEAQSAFAVKHGILAQRFAETYRSATVESAVKVAEELTARYKIQATPSVVVQGKYRSDSGKTAGESKLIALVDALIEQDAAP